MSARSAKRHRDRIKAKAKELLGSVCVFCKSTERIEAAHISPTGLKGESRGTYWRCMDIIRHPEYYRPMCRNCHLVFDGLKRAKLDIEDPIPF